MLNEYDLKVGPQELQVLVGCLHKAPYEVVAGLLLKLQSQITEQEKADMARQEADHALLATARTASAAAPDKSAFEKPSPNNGV